MKLYEIVNNPFQHNPISVVCKALKWLKKPSLKRCASEKSFKTAYCFVVSCNVIGRCAEYEIRFQAAGVSKCNFSNRKGGAVCFDDYPPPVFRRHFSLYNSRLNLICSGRMQIMFGKQLFEEVGSKISETIANSPAKDVEKNIKAMLGGAFNRMDLVTREEFDIQQQVLIKTRTKLAALEARLAKLEAAQNPQRAALEAAEAAAEEAVAEIRQQTEAGE